jgi:hypothetical protein
VAGFYVMVSSVLIAGRVRMQDGSAPLPVLVKIVTGSERAPGQDAYQRPRLLPQPQLLLGYPVKPLYVPV